MSPACILDGKDYLTIDLVKARGNIFAEPAHRFEALAVRLPTVDLLSPAPFFAKVYTPIEALRQIRSADTRFVTKVHAMRMKQGGNLATEAKKCLDSRVVSDKVDIEIPPRHQTQCVTSNDVSVAMFCEKRH